MNRDKQIDDLGWHNVEVTFEELDDCSEMKGLPDPVEMPDCLKTRTPNQFVTKENGTTTAPVPATIVTAPAPATIVTAPAPATIVTSPAPGTIDSAPADGEGCCTWWGECTQTTGWCHTTRNRCEEWCKGKYVALPSTAKILVERLLEIKN